MSSHEVQHLLHLYGLGAVFLATFAQALCLPVPGSTVVIAAAVVAASGRLPIVGVLVVAFLGPLLGSTAGFALGRWRGERVLAWLGRRLRRSPEWVAAQRERLDRHAVVALVAARWFTGARNLAGIASGASAMTVRRFLAASVLACGLWATVTSFEFYWFGGAVLGAPTWVQALVIVAGLGGGALLVRRLTRAVT